MIPEIYKTYWIGQFTSRFADTSRNKDTVSHSTPNGLSLSDLYMLCSTTPLVVPFAILHQVPTCTRIVPIIITA